MTSSASDKRDWLVLSLRWSTGEFLKWYRTGRAGYTSCLMHAGRFSEAEAKDCEAPGQTLAVSLYDVSPELGLRPAVLNTSDLVRRLKTAAEERKRQAGPGRPA